MVGDHNPGPLLERGASIGRYMVLGQVGRGAMGEVYAAYDPELDRKVAVKLLRAEAGTAQARARLLREAQAIARLSHPNVIAVHDVGSFGDRVFVAMEYVDGYTLAYWLQASARSWQEVLRMFVAAARGLQAAHACQLVHRDFKPENVMVGRDGQVRVTDFGLARQVGVAGTGAASDAAGAPAVVTSGDDQDIDATRRLDFAAAGSSEQQHEVTARRRSAVLAALALDGRSALATDLTQTGTMMGTPAYMAPEQFQRQPTDERTDQFSFCVALYEALFGQRPFVGKSIDALVDNVLAGAIRPPPASSRVPGRVRRAVLRGLRRDPAERWPSMEALLEALTRSPAAQGRRWGLVAAIVVGGWMMATLVLRGSGAPPRARPSCQVPHARFAGVWEPVAGGATGRRAVIASAFRATGKSYAAYAFDATARLLDRYVAGWSAMYADACEAANLRGEQSPEVLDLRMGCLNDRWNELRALSDVLAEPDGEIVSNAVKAAAALTPLDRCADVRTLRAALAPARDPGTRQRVEALRDRLAGVKALRTAGRYAPALQMATQVVEGARAVDYPPVLAEALSSLAYLQTDVGKIVEADANYEEANWLAEASRHDELVAEVAVHEIYVIGYGEHDLTRAQRWIRHAQAFLDRLGGHDLLRAWMLNNTGSALQAHGDLEQAVASYRRALQIKERVLGRDDPDVAYTLTNLADTLTDLGRPQEALELSNRGVEVIGRALGWQHGDMAVQLAIRASILNQLGRYGEALRDAEHALQIHDRDLATDDNVLLYALAPLGEATLGLRLLDRAVPSLERALSIAQKDAVAMELPRLRFALARALWERNASGDRPRALSLARTAASPPPAPPSRSTPAAERAERHRARAQRWLAEREAPRR
jgi:serine/threonine protein kinase/tetratricopeptide (TPR) repeat protein